MHADAEKLLWDARLATDRIARFIADRSFADYLQDELLRSAVERQFEIVGEALNQLCRVDSATAAGPDALTFEVLTTPTAKQQRAFELIQQIRF